MSYKKYLNEHEFKESIVCPLGFKNEIEYFVYQQEMLLNENYGAVVQKDLKVATLINVTEVN